MEQNAGTLPESQAPTKTVIVKYGQLGFVGEFTYAGEETLSPSQAVLVETDRGIEIGFVLCYSCDTEFGVKVCPKQIGSYVDASGEEYLKRNAGKVVRRATNQDRLEEQHMRADSGPKKKYCMELAERFGLKMEVICVEHLFGGERIIFYFTAEGRIDFRELVRELAREYQTRIELRQIGARDEARLLADYEICGRECCCKNCLKTLRPVNMKMAKLQKATLDPSKVSGRCGRLRCCLRFEQKTYEDLIAQLPAVGTWVQTAQGVGRIKDRSVLTQLVQVMFENRIVSFPVEEVTVTEPPREGQVMEPRVQPSPARPEPESVTAGEEDREIQASSDGQPVEHEEAEAEQTSPESSHGDADQPAAGDQGRRPGGGRRRRNRRRKKKQ
jgi:cell fate regulator YaaT (PSP1 superfamily)